MFDLDTKPASSDGADSWDGATSVTDDRANDEIRVYVTGDGTERAAWALRCYLRAAPLRRSI